MPLSSVGAPGTAPASSSLPAGGRFRRGLRRARGPAIAMAEWVAKVFLFLLPNRLADPLGLELLEL